MADKRKSAAIAEGKSIPLLIFVFFVAGATVSVFAVSRGRLNADIERASLWHSAIVALPSVAALILSSSLMGPVLMPLCSFLYGLLLTWLSSSAVVSESFGFWLVIPQLFAMPAFFAAAALGMDNATVICKAFFKSTERVKDEWSKKFVLTLTSVTAVLLAAYLLTWS